MCGIAGALGRWSQPHSYEMATRMIAALAHRGPDGQQVQVIAAGPDAHLSLAHARLKILDLSSAAAQPMRHDETGSWLVYNGEIYNYRALRGDLTSKGHTFRSTGDTEVLLHALVEWGTDALPRLNGMYAFAFWDGVGRRLLLARDPLGIKPLVLAATSHGLVFASEIRAVRASTVIDSGLSPGAVRSFLTYGAVIEPETSFTSVVAIPPGRVIAATPDGRAGLPANVWGLEKILRLDRRPTASSARECPDESPPPTMERTLSDAVARHLVSDVRLGVLLSGGVDSSLLAALADRIAGRQLELVTVGFEIGEPSEVDAARRVAGRLRGSHTIVPVSGSELAAMVPAALAAMDQPTVDGINVFAVSSAAAKAGIRVLLSGLGGDELFGGYTTFRRVPLVARFGRALATLAPLMKTGDRRRHLLWSKLACAGRISERRDAYLLQRAIRWGPSHPTLPALEGPPGDVQLPPETWERLSAAAEWDAPHELAYLELSFYMRNQLLRDADIFSSAVAVEMRLPYLDVEVLQAAWRMPAADFVSRGSGKPVTRRLLRTLLPDVPQSRRKVGFTFPWHAWLRGPLKPLVGDAIHTSAEYHSLGIDSLSARRMFDQFLQGSPTVSWFHVWSLFVLLCWQNGQRQSRAA